MSLPLLILPFFTLIAKDLYLEVMDIIFLVNFLFSFFNKLILFSISNALDSDFSHINKTKSLAFFYKYGKRISSL